MEKDQLLIYATSHRGSIYYQIGVALVFLGLRHVMYGMPAGWQGWLVEAAALSVSPYMLMRQVAMYTRIVQKGDALKPAECPGLIAEIGVNKLFYMAPWLLFLFWPLQPADQHELYHHLLGFIFVFSVIAAYASASAAMLSLLLFDIGIPALFGLAVTSADWYAAIHFPPSEMSAQEASTVRYVALAIVAVAGYALVVGRTVRQSILQLISTKYQLKKAARSAEEANKAKSSFLALMSHEIRTPMTGIFGMIDFLKETNLTEEQRSFIGTISECSKTLLNTLNDILDFSKVESGKLAISKTNFDFHSMLENSIRILNQNAENKGLALNIEIASDVPKEAFCDPHRLQQITVNLLNNAVKFTSEGSVTLRASYRAGEKPMLRVEVADTGIGISKENIGKLFQAFSQAEGSISRKFGGTGLGLSIAKSLIGLMGGEIGVNSEEGKGSTFWYEVPYEPPAAETKKAGSNALSVDLEPMKILVAEDNVINARIISKLLSHKGHHVTVVGNGQEALKAAQIHPYDLVLMDVNMPIMDGIAATRAIRNLGEAHRRMPIIGLTANVLEEYVKRCYDAGMVAHVAKPFTPESIMSAIVNAMHPPEPAEPVEFLAPDKAKAPAATPAPTPGSYSVVAQKKVLANAPKSMNEVLEALRNELGEDYLLQTIDNDLDEVKALAARVAAEFRNGNIEALTKASHDLKSVSGVIGMRETSGLAAQIQDDCLNGQKDGLAAAVEKLEKAVAQETQEAQKIAAGMAAA